MNTLLLLCTLSACFCNDYSFISEYAPRIWMAQDEAYFPCSVEYYTNYTHIEKINGKNWIISNKKLDNPSDVFPYFYGQNPGKVSVPVYVIITPNPCETDPVTAIDQPWNHSIIATYFTLYAYNRGKSFLDTVWDNHFGDLEHVHIYFTNGKPTKVVASYHSWDVVKKWGDPGIELVNNTHPVLYAAWGSHGLWFSVGDHEYVSFPKLVDHTSQGTVWDTWEDLDIIFPWEWNSISWLNKIYRWGDPHTDFLNNNCYTIGTYTFCRLGDGPVGMLGKSVIQEIIQGLVKKGIVCDTCEWNAGIFN